MFALSLLILGVNGLTDRALRDQITNLPDAPKVDFNQYSGYVEINATSKASIFYWFQECELGLTKCPLFLWTNGGIYSHVIFQFETYIIFQLYIISRSRMFRNSSWFN